MTIKLFPDDYGTHGPGGGDWIVIRPAPGEPAMGFYLVTETSAGEVAQSDGARVSEPMTVTGESWLQALSRAHAYTVPAGDVEAIGSFLSPGQRSRFFDAAAKALATGEQGVGLEALVREAGYLPLPPTLGGAYAEIPRDSHLARKLGNTRSATPAKDAAQAAYRDPLRDFRTVVPADGPDPQTYDVSQRLNRHNTILRGTLGKSMGVIHNDATAARLSTSGTGERSGAPDRQAEPVIGRGQPDFQSLGAAQGVSALDLIQGTFSADPNMVEMFPSLETWNGATPDVPEAGLANALKRVPCLIYRMRPWRAMALSAYAGQLDVLSFIDPARFEQVTWKPDERAQVVSETEVIHLRRTQRLNDYANAVTCGLPKASSAPVQFMIDAGLPMFRSRNVALFGANLYEVNWPFFEIAEDPPPARDGGVEVIGGLPFRLREDNETIDTIVLHDTAGWTVDGALNWWQVNLKAFDEGRMLISGKPPNQKQIKPQRLSSHFIIDEDGSYKQFADPAVYQAIHTGGGWNRGSIGIDLVSNPFGAGVGGYGKGADAEARKARRVPITYQVKNPHTGQITSVTKLIVPYTDLQIAKLVAIVKSLQVSFPSIKQRLLLPLNMHLAADYGATPPNFAGVIAHAETTGGDHSDGLYGIQALWDNGVWGIWTGGA